MEECTISDGIEFDELKKQFEILMQEAMSMQDAFYEIKELVRNTDQVCSVMYSYADANTSDYQFCSTEQVPNFHPSSIRFCTASTGT